MADDVVIGSASVQIVGDYSGLAKSFQESQNLAQSAGQQISTSLESGAAGANNLTSAINGTADALTGIITPTADAEAKLQELFAQGMSVSEAMAALGAQTSQAASTEEQLGAASGQAAAGVASVGQAAQQATPALQEASQASNSLLDSLMQFAATAITAAAIQRIGEESIMAYGRLQQLTTSLNLMGAGAAGAAEKVDELKALSIQLAIPFENLAHQAQGLAAQFGTGEGMTAVLIAAANAAGGAGKSFDAASAAIERIGVTGAVSARQLFALGLNWEDMAKSMSVSIADAQEKLKKGGQDAQQDVSDVIDAINTKFHDAAEMQAQNTLGVWTNLKNQAEFIFQSIGEDLAPIVDVFSGVMKVLASGFELFVGGIKLAVDAVIGLVLEGMASLRGLGQVAADVAAGNFVKAVSDAGIATQAMRNAAERTNTELLSDSLKTAAKLESIWSDSAKKISASFTPSGGGGGGADSALQATRDKVKGIADLTNQTAVWIAMEKQELAAQQAVVNETAKYNEANHTLLTTGEYLLTQTIKIGNAMRSIPDAAAPADNHLKVLEKDSDKLYQTIHRLGDSIDEAGQQALDTTPWGKMDAALKTLGLSVDDTGAKTRKAKTEAAEFVAANSTDLANVTASWQTLNSEINRLSKVNLPAAIAMQNELIESMQRVEAPLGQIYQAQQKELQLEIELRSERGRDANLQLVSLEMMRIKTNALKDSTQALGQLAHSLHDDYSQLFDGFANGVAKSILKGGEFWRFWHDIWQKFEEEVLTNVISAVLKYGASWVTAHLLGAAAGRAHDAAEIAGITTVSGARAAATTAQLASIAAVTTAQTAAIATVTAEQLASFVAIKAASTLLDVSEVLGSAAVGGAAAAASTAAIPIIGPALALEAGAAMYASIAGIYTPLATFSEGGMVPEDMLALVHKGEYVLPAEKTAQAMVGGGTGPSAGETHLHFDFSGAHFTNGISDNQVASIFNRGFRLSKLAGALPPGRFPQ